MSLRKKIDTKLFKMIEYYHSQSDNFGRIELLMWKRERNQVRPICDSGVCSGECCMAYTGINAIEAWYLIELENRGLISIPWTKVARIAEKRSGFIGKNKTPVAAQRIKCAFQGSDGKCKIYQYRPLNCRTFYSNKRVACIDMSIESEMTLHIVNVPLAARFNFMLFVTNDRHELLRNRTGGDPDFPDMHIQLLRVKNDLDLIKYKTETDHVLDQLINAESLFLGAGAHYAEKESKELLTAMANKIIREGVQRVQG